MSVSIPTALARRLLGALADNEPYGSEELAALARAIHVAGPDEPPLGAVVVWDPRGLLEH